MWFTETWTASEFEQDSNPTSKNREWSDQVRVCKPKWKIVWYRRNFAQADCSNLRELTSKVHLISQHWFQRSTLDKMYKKSLMLTIKNSHKILIWSQYCIELGFLESWVKLILKKETTGWQPFFDSGPMTICHTWNVHYKPLKHFWKWFQIVLQSSILDSCLIFFSLSSTHYSCNYWILLYASTIFIMFWRQIKGQSLFVVYCN